MKISGGFQNILAAVIVYFRYQFAQITFHILHSRTNFMNSCYIIMLFEFPRSFLVYNISTLIIRTTGEDFVDFLDEFNAQWLYADDFFFQNLITQFLILLLKQSMGTSCIVRNLAVFEDFPCIVIGYFLILNAPRMERKQDAEAVKVFIQIGSGRDSI